MKKRSKKIKVLNRSDFRDLPCECLTLVAGTTRPSMYCRFRCKKQENLCFNVGVVGGRAEWPVTTVADSGAEWPVTTVAGSGVGWPVTTVAGSGAGWPVNTVAGSG